ncbi:hypothetical protein [Novosphingobium hassiacum]|nr:hypothetical protein [Novosphingobium hassiacum]
MTVWMVAVGISCVAAACLHGYLGEVKLIGPATFPTRQSRLLVSAMWQFSTMIWIGCGVLIAASPWLFSDSDRPLAIPLICSPILFGVVANGLITRGRHFGWKVFAAIVVAAMGGAILA